MAASGHGKEKAMVCGQAQVWETRPTALLKHAHHIQGPQFTNNMKSWIILESTKPEEEVIVATVYSVRGPFYQP